MFGYKVEARLRRDRDKSETTEPTPGFVFSDEMYKDLLRHTALTAVSVYAVVTVLGTSREVIVNLTNPAYR